MSKYWKTLIAVVVLTGAASSIAVADGYEPVGKGFAPPPTTNWSGFYGGVSIGGRTLDADWTTTKVFDSQDPPHATGVLELTDRIIRQH